MLAKVLSLLTPAAEASEPVHVPPADPRQCLREAQKELARAEAALEDSRQATHRARSAVREAAEAEEAVKLAEAAAEAGATQWAAAGAEGDMPPQAQRLFEAADRARTRAYAAQLKARGAESALTQTQFDSSYRGEILATERDAVVARDQAREAVGSAVRAVLMAEVFAPAMARAEELHAQLEAQLSRVLPLWQLMRMSTNVYAFAGGARELAAQLERLTFPVITEQLGRDNTMRRSPQQLDAEAALADFGKRLATDANAGLR